MSAFDPKRTRAPLKAHSSGRVEVVLKNYEMAFAHHPFEAEAFANRLWRITLGCEQTKKLMAGRRSITYCEVSDEVLRSALELM